MPENRGTWSIGRLDTTILVGLETFRAGLETAYVLELKLHLTIGIQGRI